jgi:5-(carboxyamino)imidazole ribonucleotide mutase
MRALCVKPRAEFGRLLVQSRWLVNDQPAITSRVERRIALSGGRMSKVQSPPPVAIIMGSQSDWATMKHAAETLDALGVRHDDRIVSAHRTPDRLVAFAKGAALAGYRVIIAGAGGAAHLPGMTAAMTHLPVLGVPVESKALSGVDSLHSIVQMPGGVPVGTLAIGKPGAINAALLTASILALSDAELGARLIDWRRKQSDAVAERPRDE